VTDLVVLGGGAAGFFGAIRAAEANPDARVTLLEAGSTFLSKVKISGGGRCNVTRAVFDPVELVKGYPRGATELRGVFSRFQPRDTVAWFEARGVRLKAEPDLRMFPVTDDSQTIIDCLLGEARKGGVALRTHAAAEAVTREGDGFVVSLRGGAALRADAILLATGSNPKGLAIAQSLGHKLVAPVPSLFNFVIHDPRLEDLAGITVPQVATTLKVGDLKLQQTGSVLVTHAGLSGLALLRLSAWGARELHAANYQATLVVDWVPTRSEADLRAAFDATRTQHPKGTVGANAPFPEVPRRLWERLLAASGIAPDTKWAEAPRKGLNLLTQQLKLGAFPITGKGPFKEEFVTCGGVSRKEVDFRTMESRVCPGLYFAGEVLDIDGITGGFNFQNAWSTGWIAGGSMAARGLTLAEKGQ